MTVSKPFLTITSLIVAALFGGGVYFYMNMDLLAKNFAQSIASDALGVDVSMDSLTLELKEKRATVNKLTIANPFGFEKDNALEIENISITLGQISKELIVFKDISVSGTDVYLEVKPEGTNLHAIRQGMPKPDPDADASRPTKIKVIIDRMAMTSAKLNPTVTLLSTQDVNPVTVPNITLTGIGREENGVLARQAVSQIFTRLTREFSQAARQAGFYEGLSSEVINELGAGRMDDIKDKLKDGLNKVGDSIKGLF